MPYILQKSQNQLPKTGQTTSYQAGDDGDYEAGWNGGTRFIEKTISGDAVVIDHATGLMWPKDWNGAASDYNATKSFYNAIIFANNLVFAGFSDWRIPNINEYLTLIDYSRYALALPTIFTPSPVNGTYRTSTSSAYNTSRCWTISFYYGAQSYSSTKADLFYFIVCRSL